MSTSITRRIVAAAAGGALALGAFAAVPAAHAAPGKAKASQSQSAAQGQAKALAHQVRTLGALLDRTALRYDAFAVELETRAATLTGDQQEAAVSAAALLRQLAGEVRVLAVEVRTASSKVAVWNFRKDRVALVKQAAPSINLLKQLRSAE